MCERQQKPLRAGGCSLFARWSSRLGIVATLCGGAQFAQSQQETEAAKPTLPAALEDAPVHTWVRLHRDQTGAREWPMFVYHPTLGKFFFGGGAGGNHYDTETFDLATATWRNLFPEGIAYKAAVGPVNAPAVKTRGPAAFAVDDDGVLRMNRSHFPWGRDAATYHQYALSTLDGKIYAYYQYRTLAFCPQTRRWKDLNANNFAKVRPSSRRSLVLGSLAYDPVNNEILSVGGVSDNEGGTPGTWAYSIAGNRWTRVAAGSEPLRALNEQAADRYRAAEALVNRIRNRFHRAETATEAAADLDDLFAAESEALRAFIESLRNAQLADTEQRIVPVALAAYSDMLAHLNALANEKSDTSALLIRLQAWLDDMERARPMLDAEPGGRGVTQMALDPVRGKIVLFGGMRLNSYLGDTWVYDCRSRTWEQRWPERSPAPRSGHTLAWLPRSGKILLYGANRYYSTGYGIPFDNPLPPQDLWVYDIEANTWKLLAAQSELKSPGIGVGAVGPNDILVLTTPNHWGRRPMPRETWAMKVDAAAAESALADKVGVASASVAYYTKSPAAYDRSAKIEPARMDTLLENLAVNIWTPLPRRSRGANGHEWGSSVYDTRRHQILFWGGGHSSWHFNDVSHFSLRAATWSVGYREEYPYPSAAFQAHYNQTFNNRPFFGSHVWDANAYDAVADRLVATVRGVTWTYNPATRQWDYPPTAAPPQRSEHQLCMEETPRGVVQWTHDGNLFLFDAAKRVWTKLPITGGKLWQPSSDSSGMVYDPQRDALWMAVGNGSRLARYDMKSGHLESRSTRGADGAYMRELAYVPALDMLISVGRIAGPDGRRGNAAYDMESNRWKGLALPFADGKNRDMEKRGWALHTMALHSDPDLDLLTFHLNSSEVLIARIDKEKLDIFDLPETKKKP